MSSPIKRNIPKATFFGRNLKFLRRLEGISQTELANRVGLKRNHIASYESSVVEPSGLKFMKVCAYFNVSPVDMLERLFSESPKETLATTNSSGIDHPYFVDQLDLFIQQTNEMTKIYEGYASFQQLQHQLSADRIDSSFDNILQDLMLLMKSLIDENWGLIQSFSTEEE